jgi:VRR-NUC domain
MTLTRARLTSQERADRALTESEFQRAVTDLAAMLGWSYVHFRPAQTARGWRTPVEGPLGQGWPDLVLVSPQRHRVLAVELKRELGSVSADQAYVHAVLEAGGLAVRVWRPSDLTNGTVEAELRGANVQPGRE